MTYFPMIIACLSFSSPDVCETTMAIGGFGQETQEECMSTREAGEQYTRMRGAVPMGFYCVPIPEGDPV